MNINDNVKHCYGCNACKNICPFDAIEIKEDLSGFLRAYVNGDKCKECGKCLNVCPSLVNSFDNMEEPICYASWADDDIRLKCASGGVFTAIAIQIIERGGWVAGAVWGEDYHVKFELTNTLEGLQRISNSKYVQGNVGSIYNEIEEKLKRGIEVLFSGCPCQVAGLKSFLGQTYDTLYTVDLICHGVPSHKMLTKYLKDTYCYENIKKVDFRDKSHFGWSTEMNVYLDEGNVVRSRASEDAFYRAFLNNMSLNPTCEVCQFSTLPRQGDISLGDFWQIERYNPDLNDGKGTSLVLVNNQQGRALLDECTNIVMKEEVPLNFISETCNSTVFKPFVHHFGSHRFLKEFMKQDYAKVVNQCLSAHYDIGLITTWFARNFGAIFTAYALYTKLEEMGYSVLMLHKPIELWGNRYFDHKNNNIAMEFGSRYYNVSKQYSINEGEYGLRKLNNHCDVFMTGSDQLWNPKVYAKLFYFFMDFVDDKHKKIAYATSVGACRFQGTQEEKKKIEYLLSRFDNVSVREQEAVDVCRNELGTYARQVLDPVFLLDKCHYSNMAKQPLEKESIPSKFLFVYILDGNISKRDFVNFLSKKYNLPVLCAYDIENSERSKNYMQIPEVKIKKPEEWLWYIKNSELVITDSYHGACFSIIFNKEFFCIGNTLRGINRFIELFKKLNIEERLIYENAEGVLKVPHHDKKISYERVNQYIQHEKENSLAWLKNALNELKIDKYTHENYLFECADKRIDYIEKEFNKKTCLNVYSDISQLGLSAGCSVEDIIKRLENNSYFQQAQGKLGEPISDTPVPYGILTIKKTTEFFVEVSFSAVCSKNCASVMWLATVNHQKIVSWCPMIAKEEVEIVKSELLNEIDKANKKIEELEHNIKSILQKD